MSVYTSVCMYAFVDSVQECSMWGRTGQATS